MELIQELASASVVLGFIGGLFSFFVLRPLNTAIVELRLTVRELRDDLRVAEERRHQLELMITKVDEKAKAAHRRLDEMKGVETPKRREDNELFGQSAE